MGNTPSAHAVFSVLHRRVEIKVVFCLRGLISLKGNSTSTLRHWRNFSQLPKFGQNGLPTHYYGCRFVTLYRLIGQRGRYANQFLLIE